MDEVTQVVELPSGNTWTLIVKPKWGRLKGLSTLTDSTDMLVQLTDSWSFPEPVSADAVDNERDVEDVIAAFAAMNTAVLPLLGALGEVETTPKTE